MRARSARGRTATKYPHTPRPPTGCVRRLRRRRRRRHPCSARTSAALTRSAMEAPTRRTRTAKTGPPAMAGSVGHRDPCAYGTDCTDCGPRYYMPPSPPPSPPPPSQPPPPPSPSPSSPPPTPPAPSPPPPSAPPPYVCENTCRNRFGGGGPQYANNKHCQDGHPDAEGNTCMLGTDCDD